MSVTVGSRCAYRHPRHDHTGKLTPGVIGPSNLLRQWIGLSTIGDSAATIELLPSPPHPAAPAYLESITFDLSFFNPRAQVEEAFSADEISKVFVKAYAGILVSINEPLVFEFRGHNLKAVTKGLTLLELADTQHGGQSRFPGSGILMDKTDVSFTKAGDSAIKIKSSAKK